MRNRIEKRARTSGGIRESWVFAGSRGDGRVSASYRFSILSFTHSLARRATNGCGGTPGKAALPGNAVCAHAGLRKVCKEGGSRDRGAWFDGRGRRPCRTAIIQSLSPRPSRTQAPRPRAVDRHRQHENPRSASLPSASSSCSWSLRASAGSRRTSST